MFNFTQELEIKGSKSLISENKFNTTKIRTLRKENVSTYCALALLRSMHTYSDIRDKVYLDDSYDTVTTRLRPYGNQALLMLPKEVFQQQSSYRPPNI